MSGVSFLFEKTKTIVSSPTAQEKPLKNKVSGADLGSCVDGNWVMSHSVCRFYNATGKCSFGKHCKFSHSKPSLESKVSVSGTNNNGILSEPYPVDSPVGLVDKFSSNDQETRNNGSLGYQSQNSSEGAVPPERNICRSYARTRFCRYGKRCRYLHIQFPRRSGRSGSNVSSLRKTEEEAKRAESIHKDEKETEESQTDKELQNENVKLNEVLKQVRISEDGPQQRKICYFFKQGHCHYGKRCRFLHVKGRLEVPSRNDTEQQTPSESLKAVKPTFQAPHIQVYNRDSVSSETLKQLRETELRQLKRRFPKEKLQIAEEGDTSSRYIITFSPTDPDWVSDLLQFRIPTYMYMPGAS